MRCVAASQVCIAVTHRRAIRTTNLLERLFVEERGRLKNIPNAFGERAVLKLMFGALIRAAERWRSVKSADGRSPKRTRSGIRGLSRPQYAVSRGGGPGQNIQQVSDLTVKANVTGQKIANYGIQLTARAPSPGHRAIESPCETSFRPCCLGPNR